MQLKSVLSGRHFVTLLEIKLSLFAYKRPDESGIMIGMSLAL